MYFVSTACLPGLRLEIEGWEGIDSVANRKPPRNGVKREAEARRR